MDNLFIQFNGILVSNDNRLYIENCFQSIFSLSPSDSSVSLNFFKTDEGFSGDIAIVSQMKFFEANTDNNSIIEVMIALNKNIANQLREWKSQRFKTA